MKNPVWLASGGTGGHVFPALSLADALETKGVTICMLTDRRGGRLMAKTRDFISVPSGSPFAGSVLRRLIALGKLASGGIIILGLILKMRPSCVIGFGGYPSFMPMLMAKLFGIPVLMHEQNAIMGRSNQLLASWARLIMTSWPATSGLPQQGNVIHTGLPIRQAFSAIPAYQPDNTSHHILVLGGSQGAYLFGELVVNAITSMPASIRAQITVTHQVREEQIDDARAQYQKANMQAEIASFFDDVPEKMAQADIIICRAGASSVAEIATAGRPAIFIPFAGAMDDHQTANASALEVDGGAVMINEAECSKEALSDMLSGLLGAPQTRKKLASQARLHSHSGAAENMVRAIFNAVSPTTLGGAS